MSISVFSTRKRLFVLYTFQEMSSFLIAKSIVSVMYKKEISRISQNLKRAIVLSDNCQERNFRIIKILFEFSDEYHPCRHLI